MQGLDSFDDAEFAQDCGNLLPAPFDTALLGFVLQWLRKTSYVCRELILYQLFCLFPWLRLLEIISASQISLLHGLVDSDSPPALLQLLLVPTLTSSNAAITSTE